jgi:hypothetical protein
LKELVSQVLTQNAKILTGNHDRFVYGIVDSIEAPADGNVQE